jgi:hypothetical protein
LAFFFEATRGWQVVPVQRSLSRIRDGGQRVGNAAQKYLASQAQRVFLFPILRFPICYIVIYIAVYLDGATPWGGRRGEEEITHRGL